MLFRSSNLSAFSLKFCLDVVSFVFGCTLLKNLRSAVYNVLSFLEAKTCYFTNNFDNFYFVRSNFCKFYVELIFFFCCCSILA